MLNVVLRTCDKNSLTDDRIVNKRECILRCLNSLLENLKDIDDKELYIIDDNSSEEFVTILKEMTKSYDYITINFLPSRNEDGLNSKQKSRYSVGLAYEYIYNIPDENLVYIVEDDYLHFPGAIKEMIETWKLLSSTSPENIDIGIFPQDFNQLYFHPKWPNNETYCEPCHIVSMEKRYYRTTWFTHESFMIQSKIFKKNKEHFDLLMEIGNHPKYWEGNTISSVWTLPTFRMFMPIGTLVVHMSRCFDISFYIKASEVKKLWESNKTPWSNEKKSYLNLSDDDLLNWKMDD